MDSSNDTEKTEGVGFFPPHFDGEKNIHQDDLWMRHVRASKMMIYKARQGAPCLQQEQKKHWFWP